MRLHLHGDLAAGTKPPVQRVMILSYMAVKVNRAKKREQLAGESQISQNIYVNVVIDIKLPTFNFSKSLLKLSLFVTSFH